jgi:hypothetical protein
MGSRGCGICARELSGSHSCQAPPLRLRFAASPSTRWATAFLVGAQTELSACGTCGEHRWVTRCWGTPRRHLHQTAPPLPAASKVECSAALSAPAATFSPAVVRMDKFWCGERTLSRWWVTLGSRHQHCQRPGLRPGVIRPPHRCTVAAGRPPPFLQHCSQDLTLRNHPNRRQSRRAAGPMMRSHRLATICCIERGVWPRRRRWQECSHSFS